MLLHGGLDLSVVEGSLQLSHAPLTLEELNKLSLDEHEDLADLTLCSLGGQLDVMSAVCLTSHVFSLVLCDLLRHHLIVETEGVLVRLCVVKFIAIGLNDIRFTWARRVMKSVLLGTLAITHHVLVLPSGILLLNQALSRRDVPLHVIRRRVEVIDHLVEVIVLREL